METYILVPERMLTSTDSLPNVTPLLSEKEEKFNDRVSNITHSYADKYSKAAQLQTALRSYLARSGEKMEKTNLGQKRPKQFDQNDITGVAEDQPEFEPGSTNLELLKTLGKLNPTFIDDLYNIPAPFPKSRLPVETDEERTNLTANLFEDNDNDIPWDHEDVLETVSDNPAEVTDQWSDKRKVNRARRPDSSSPAVTRSKSQRGKGRVLIGGLSLW